MESKYVKLDELNFGVLTYEIDEKINGEIFRKNIVVDLRYLDKNSIIYIL